MPIYDYVCGSCRHRFEAFHGINEVGPRQCPLCEGPVSRAFAPPNIVFKGSGWAKMDRRSASAKTKRSGGSEPRREGASEAPGGTSGSSESTGGAPTSAPGAPAGPPAD